MSFLAKSKPEKNKNKQAANRIKKTTHKSRELLDPP